MATAASLTAVQKIYIAFYQRPADSAGQVYWAGRLDAEGGDLNGVINAFANSPEATALYGAITTTNISATVKAIYLALFNRVVDDTDAGLKFWVDGFNAGTFTPGKIALEILNAAQGGDAVSVQNKLQVANSFSAAVDGRLMTAVNYGQGTTFAATYSGTADAVAAREMLSKVTSAPSTVLSSTQVTDFVIEKIADAGDAIFGSSSQIVTLTNGTDVRTGNVFNANQVYTPGGDDRINSLQDEDNLTGTGTNPTLNATLGNANDNGGIIITPKLNGIQTVNLAFTGTGGAAGAVVALDMQDATGLNAVNISRVSQATNLARVENIQQAVTSMSIANTNANTAGVVEFSFGSGALAGATPAATLTLSNVQVGLVNIGGNTSGVGGAGVGGVGYEDLTIASSGSANAVGVLNVPQDTGTAGKITINGNQNLRLGTTTAVVNAVGTTESVTYGGGIAQANGRLATVDASALTGNLTLNMGAGFFTTGKADTSGTVQNVAVTGGAGSDTFILSDVIQAGDSLTGGGGNDTLIVANGGVINNLSSIVSSIEAVQLRVDAGPFGAAGASTVDFSKLSDATSVLVHNETSNGAGAPSASGVVTYNLNNLTASLAGAVNVSHSNTGSNGITQNVINANLANAAGAADLVVLNINEGLNTNPRFNGTLATQVTNNGVTFSGAVESITLNNLDSESNTIALASVAQHTGTLTLSSGANAAAAGTFMNLDTTVAGGNGGLYGYDVTGAAGVGSLDFTNGRIQELSAVVGQVKVAAATVNAAAEAGNVVVRVSSNAASAVGAQTITMGSGNDTVIFDNTPAVADTRAGLTISDTVAGGAGTDTLVIDGNVAASQIALGASEWTNVSGFEAIRLVNAGAGSTYSLTLTDALIAANNNAGTLAFVNDHDGQNDTGLTTAQAAAVVGGNDVWAVPESNVTIDASAISATSKFSYNGEEGLSRTADRLIFSDVNMNGNAVVDGGAIDNITDNRGIAATTPANFPGNGVNANLGNADVIEVRNSAVVSQGDLANIRNIGTLSFTNSTAVTQVSTLQLNDAIVDNLVDSYQTSVSRAAAATATAGGANVEVLQINGVDNTNVGGATVGLNIEAGTLTDRSDLSVTLGRGANVVATGAGQDRVVLLGNYATGAYGATENGVSINAQANNAAGNRAVTDNINLGTGFDTLVTYGNINLAGATLAGVEALVANSNVVLTETQYRNLGSLFFSATGPHTLTIQADGSAGAIDLTKITSDTSLVTILNNSADVVSGLPTGINGGTAAIGAGGALSVTMLQALSADYRANDPLTVLDTGANITTALNNGSVATNDAAQPGEVDFFDATDNVLALTVAGAGVALNARLTAADVVTLADTGANLATVAGLNAAAFANVDFVDAIDNALTLSLVNLNAVTNAKLTAADVVTLADSGANLAAIAAAAYAGFTNVDIVDATNDAVSFTADQVAAVTNARLVGAGDVVTLADAAAAIQALSGATLASYTNVDFYDATPNALSLTVAQATGLGNKFTATDVVTIADTGANLAANVGGLGSNFTGFGTLANTDVLDASDNAVSLTLAQFAAVAAAGPKFAAGDALTVSMTTAADTIAALTGAHAAAGVEVLRYTASNQAGTAAFTDVAGAALANTDTFTLTLPDVVTGFTAGTDKINLTAFGLTGASGLAQFGATGSKVADNEYIVVRGGYNVGTGVFTADGAGADSLVVWDGNTSALSVTQASVVLVGTVATAADLILA